MKITFDPSKEAINQQKHKLSLADFPGFDDDPDVVVDDRYNYGEVRYQARGRIDGRGYCLVYTIRGDAMHLISFRRAHEKEMRRYE